MVETNSVELMKGLAQNAPHIAFLNLADVREEIARGTLAFTPLSDPAAVTQVASLVQRDRSALEPAAHLVATRIEAAFDKHSGGG